MIRTASLVLLGLAVGLTVFGCGNKSNSQRNDMPVKTSTGGGPGKKGKTIEAALEDPPRK